MPSSQRVEVLVHDGASDLRLWPGPGPDRNLLDAYGPGLREALDAQRNKRGELAVGDIVRLHPGKLHCNYLLWAVTRGPEKDAQQADAPGLDVIEKVVLSCLDIAANNASVSIGFGALGDGPRALPPEERLAAIVRTAHRYHENCYATGRPTRVEIVRVCDPRSGVTAAARRLVGRLAQSPPEPPSSPREAPSAPARRSSSSAGRARPNMATVSSRRRLPEVLDPNEVAHRRVTATPYDRSQRYKESDWFVHPRFGVGQVKRLTPEGAIEVLFEDGTTKKMLHAHSG